MLKYCKFPVKIKTKLYRSNLQPPSFRCKVGTTWASVVAQTVLSASNFNGTLKALLRTGLSIYICMSVEVPAKKNPDFLCLFSFIISSRLVINLSNANDFNGSVIFFVPLFYCFWA